ncbi:hypothetical protein KBTX_01495 [wastewater metagenome]|uniref:Response regulatory domain-containing protein n=2 Tax=unclassified sequences TaxID=12908 RepID=A0A5B8R8V2_9ZZZZ|nr:response regulator transcription factor [Arhodomonas sp. KWT]QEA05176.1 hypothetical protein KBTEX_01495 [uncultured organism]
MNSDRAYPTLTVWLVHDNDRLRIRLDVMASAVPGIVVTAAIRQRDVTSVLRSHTTPDVVIVGGDSNVRDALHLVRHLASALPHTRIAVMSNRTEAAYAREFADAGAHVYLGTDEGPGQLAVLLDEWADTVSDSPVNDDRHGS